MRPESSRPALVPPRFFGIHRETAAGALVVVQALALPACESDAPARAADLGRRPASAVDWTGSRVLEAGPSSTDPDARVAKDVWVLHVGDSFVHAWLRQNLGPRFHALGAGYVVDGTTATYTTTWANDTDLDHWLSLSPALVLVTLGANEVDMPIPSMHAAAVRQLAHKIESAGADCVWITPPLWKDDTGILQVIHDNSAPCVFFDSDAVLGGLSTDERQPDGIHPNPKGGARWANAFWSWLVDHRDASKSRWGLVPFEARGT